MLFATTANDGHFGPLLPFARAGAGLGHEVRVAAPTSYGTALARAGLPHEPFADAAPEVPRLLADPSYAESARRVAAALRELPHPTEAVSVLTELAG